MPIRVHRFSGLPVDDAPRRYRGGSSTSRTSAGYIRELCPGHPRADSAGFVLQHRLVMELELGRFLQPGEAVHHLNHRKDDNRPENLLLMTPSAHMSHHSRERWASTPRTPPAPKAPRYPAVAALTEERVREALRGRSTAQAAATLGVHPMTLRNRWGHLLARRASPDVLFPHRAVVLRLLGQGATHLEVGKAFGVHEETVRSSVRRWSRRGAIPAGLAAPPRRRPGPKPGSRRRAQGTAPSSS